LIALLQAAEKSHCSTVGELADTTKHLRLLARSETLDAGR